MQAQRGISELVAEIDVMCVALKKTNHSAAEIARTINNVLLQKGIGRDTLGQAWDLWFAKYRASEEDQGHDG